MIQKQLIVVWHHDNSTEVLQKKGNDRYFIPLSFTSTDILRSLGAPISDALKADSESKTISGSLAQGAGPGRKTCQHLLNHYARCLKTQQWPSCDLLAKGQDAWTAVDIGPWMERGVGSAPAADPSQPEPQDLLTSHAE